jgi:hypothetical protein
LVEKGSFLSFPMRRARKPGIELEGATSNFSYSCRAVEKQKRVDYGI